MCFTWVGSCHTCKHYTILERDEHSSLLQKFVTYGRKKFYNNAPGLNFVANYGQERIIFKTGEKPATRFPVKNRFANEATFFLS